ncbi:MAG: aryl-sulfate sulfotransferase [Solirubrobacterales bacterium]
MTLARASLVCGRRTRFVASGALALVIAMLCAASAQGQPPGPGKVSFTTKPALSPNFSPGVHDYVAHCNGGSVTVAVHASSGWHVRIDDHPYRKGDFSEVVPLSAGQALTVTERRTQSEIYSYYVRCLPEDFPQYTFTRFGPVSPKYFTVNNGLAPPDHRYGIIFNNQGVPVWWYRSVAKDIRVLADGTLLWANGTPDGYEVHRLDGTLVRTLNGVGRIANDHDLRFVGNGDYLIGAYVRSDHVDTSAYGGSSDASVTTTELQQVSADGQLVWDWNSQDHISLDETGRWWPWAMQYQAAGGYDLLHWNSIEPDGDSVIVSFRHLDAIYKIDKTTGDIVWKLGGTPTPESLTVVGDNHAKLLGGQHDARLLPDGTLTVFDDRTMLSDRRPRALRFRIDEQAGTATLLESITDSRVPVSQCCGSARRLPNGDWLVGWGGKDNPIAGYRSDGHRTFLMTLGDNRSYRAQPVPTGAVSAQDLRDGMSAIYGEP